MKECSKCGELKDLSLFSKRSGSKDGFRGHCKSCVNENSRYNCKKYYSKNRDVLLNKSKKRKLEKIDPNSKIRTIKRLFKMCPENHSICTKCELIKELSNFSKDFNRKNKVSAHCNQCKNDYRKKRKSYDDVFKLSTTIRSMISSYIKSGGVKKSKSSQEILGCSFFEFKNYLELKFMEGMSWDNYGSWHLDHIIPISYANTENDIYELNHYSNFQPLWAFDNLSKGNRFIG